MAELEIAKRSSLVKQALSLYENMLIVKKQPDNNDEPKGVSPNKFYIALAIVAVVIGIRAIWSIMVDAENPDQSVNFTLLLLLYAVLIIPWMLIAVYFFDKYELKDTVRIKIPFIGGELPFPGGTFIVPTIFLVGGILLATIDYKQQSTSKSPFVAIENGLKGVEERLNSRISSSFNFRFAESWVTVKNQRCDVTHVFYIPESDLEACLRPGNDITTLSTGHSFLSGLKECNLKTSIEREIKMEKPSAYSDMFDEGKYHALVMVQHIAPHPKGTSMRFENSFFESYFPDENELNSIRKSEAKRHILPLFTVLNTTLDNRVIRLHMKSISALSDLCKLSNKKNAV